MLGFDALGRLALGQIGHAGAVAVTLTADTGAYTYTGNGATFTTTLVGAVTPYVLTGNAAVFTTTMPVASTSYALTGNGASFNVTLAATAGAFALSGGAAAFDTNFSVSAASFVVSSGTHTLIRTGDETEQVYGGVGHYLEELAKRRQLEKITKRRPVPVVQRLPELRPLAIPQPVEQPAYSVLSNPDALVAQYEAQAQQMAAAEMQRQRNRRALAVLLLAAYSGIAPASRRAASVRVLCQQASDGT
jgi:hypothetical protein